MKKKTNVMAIAPGIDIVAVLSKDGMMEVIDFHGEVDGKKVSATDAFLKARTMGHKRNRVERALVDGLLGRR